MRHKPFLLAAALFAFTSATAHADDAAASASKAFTAEQKAAIEDIIKNYITKEHPEILIAASQELQKRDESTAKTKSDAAIKTSKDKIFNDPGSPVGGNPKGDVTVVEFYDYQCGYCKMAEADTEKLLKEDKNVKFIYKDFPILGPVSVTASKASLASVKQNKFVAFHDALMNKKDHLSDDIIYQTAKDVGLDVERLKKDMNEDSIAKQIQVNTDLGRDIGVRGTPMFIVGEGVYPGALQYEQLKKAVEEARTAAKK